MTSYERPFGRYLEDFTAGDILRHWPGKTITEYDDHLFCMITMNHHPLHTNDWFAAESVQGRNVVVGNLVYSLVLGMSVPDVSGAAIANLEVETLQHKFPTFHGDTIHAETRVLEVTESVAVREGAGDPSLPCLRGDEALMAFIGRMAEPSSVISLSKSASGSVASFSHLMAACSKASPCGTMGRPRK